MMGESAESILPKIAKEWKVIPNLGEDLFTEAAAPINALPKSIPHTVAAYELRDRYKFCASCVPENDWEIDWGSSEYAMEAIEIKACGKYSPGSGNGNTTPDTAVESDVCADDSAVTSGGQSYSEVADIIHKYWYKAVLKAQGVARLGVWIRDTYLSKHGDTSELGGGSLLRGRPVHAPATPVKPPQPPMPTPSFAPASSGGVSAVKVGKSAEDVLKIEKGKIEANPPDSSVGDNPVLTYDTEAKEMRWGEGSQGCCPVLLYNGKIVTGMDTDGNLILGDAVGTMAYPLYGHEYVLVD